MNNSNNKPQKYKSKKQTNLRNTRNTNRRPVQQPKRIIKGIVAIGAVAIFAGTYMHTHHSEPPATPAVQSTLEDYNINDELHSNFKIIENSKGLSLLDCSKENALEYYSAVDTVKSTINNLNEDIYNNNSENNAKFNLLKATIIDKYMPNIPCFSNYYEYISPADVTIEYSNRLEGNIGVTIEPLNLSFNLDKNKSIIAGTISAALENEYSSDNIENYSKVEDDINDFINNDLNNFKNILPEEPSYIRLNGEEIDKLEEVSLPQTLFTLGDFYNLDSSLSNEQMEEKDR